MHLRKIYCLVFFLSAFITQADSQTAISNTGLPAIPNKESTKPLYRELLNISYSKDDAENILDAFIPIDYTHAKVIVYLHGSGWTGGDKNEFPALLIDELVGKRKYIVVSANYRLIREGKNRFPAQMEDISKLFIFLNQNAENYRFSKNDYALMGGSAGAHLAMLYAYGYAIDKQIKTVVDFWGPTDFTDKAVRADNKEADAKVINLLGVSDPNAQICFEASPYYRVTKESGVPTILFHGGQDPLVHVSQADKMYKKLLSLGIKTQYEYYANEKHGMRGAAGVDVFMKTLAWLNQYFPALK